MKPAFTLHKALAIVAATSSMMLIASCQIGVCTDNKTSIPCAEFFNEQNKEISLTKVSIRGEGAVDDAELYTSDQSLSTIYLPLKATAKESTFIFHYAGNDSIDKETGEKIIDTRFDDKVSLYYSATPYFAGEECGAMYNYYLNDIRHTSNLIESIEITNPFVTNNGAVGIKIFMRTETQKNADTSKSRAINSIVALTDKKGGAI